MFKTLFAKLCLLDVIPSNVDELADAGVPVILHMVEIDPVLKFAELG